MKGVNAERAGGEPPATYNYFLGGFGLPGLSFLVILAIPNYKFQQMSSRPTSQIHLLLIHIVCECLFL